MFNWLRRKREPKLTAMEKFHRQNELGDQYVSGEIDLVTFTREMKKVASAYWFE